MTTLGLRNQVAIVTGAGSGIGRATAVVLAQAGANVVLAARTKQTLDVVAHEISLAGGTAVVIPTDVGDEKQVTNLIFQTQERFGGRIDILVTSAGGAVFGPL